MSRPRSRSEDTIFQIPTMMHDVIDRQGPALVGLGHPLPRMPTPPFPGGHRPFPVDDAEVGHGPPAECGKIPTLQEFVAELPGDHRECDLQQTFGVLKDREPVIFEANDGIPAVLLHGPNKDTRRVQRIRHDDLECGDDTCGRA